MASVGWLECRPQGIGAVHFLLLMPACPHTVHSWTGIRLMFFCVASFKLEFSGAVKEDGFVVVDPKSQ